MPLQGFRANTLQSVNGDEYCSPQNVVDMIVPYIMRGGYKRIWCPFDKDESRFVVTFKELGLDVVVKNEDGAYVKIVADSPDMRHVEFVDGLCEATKFDYEVDANRVAIAVNSYSVHTWEVEELVSEGELAIRQMIKALEERGGSNGH